MCSKDFSRLKASSICYRSRYTARTALALYPVLGSDVARIMKSAAIRLRGSSALPFLAAVRRYAERVASAAQGNRANKLCCDEAGEVVVVPCGDLSPEAEGVLAGGSARQVQRHVFDGGEVGWGVVGSDAAFVIAEDHVHDPVQAVLNGPMASHDCGQAFGWQAERSDEEPRLPFDRAADLADAVDDDDALQAGPVVALLQPGDVVDDGGGPGLDAAVIAVDGFVPAAGGVLEAVALLLGHEEFDILAQRALVAFQGE